MDTIKVIRRTGRRRLALLAALLALFLLATAFGQAPPPSPAALEGADAYRAMELANAWRGQPVSSHVTSEAVHFRFADGTTVVVPAPDDVMLVSVAPYVTNTHPCLTHTMSSCQGELVSMPTRVRATLADGTVLMDEAKVTMANGFIDLWLPRDVAIELVVEVGGFRASGMVATFAGSPTCVTTLKLGAE